MGRASLIKKALVQPYQRSYHAMKYGHLDMYLTLDEIRCDLMGLVYDPAAEK